MTTRAEIARWFDDGVRRNATHMIVVCDTHSFEDYPVYVQPPNNVRSVEKVTTTRPMQRIMEVYLLDPARKDEQMSLKRSFTYE